jgi:tetratricopeptide (TPR) repeat protein
MGDPANQAKAIFLQAIEQHAPQAWPAFLEQACAGDACLRAEVEKLLRAYTAMGSFHEAPRPAPTAVTTAAVPVTEQPGTVVGHYKLLEPIGEGGFGVVFLAEQHEPIRRKVALKVVKPGMDTWQVIARFEAERQALALMDHPHIAKVLDAGQTDSGRPYFVMELVKGLPITDYCDQGRLTPKERLELFVHVCQAVQHAHQKGIIHRDIKPSNVLVTLQDGAALVKVIDFGIAKALGQQLTDKTLFTGYAQMIGTPLYMSPEQAALSNVDVDTRSDIYSLGVLLYELLTGTTPFDRKRLKDVGYDELRRIIREEEPPRPSTRLSTMGEAATTVSAKRKSDPKRLRQLCRGELDWIVMKALEKDRNRRYESASAFAADVQRYLKDEPVQACPPSAWYRFRKFARRNKAGLVVATCLFLLLALLGSGLGWVVRDHEARQADAQSQRERADLSVRQAVTQTKAARDELHQILKQKGGVFALLNQPARWDGHLRAARAALDRARALLANAPEGIDEELLQQALALEPLLKADDADRVFALALEKVREDEAVTLDIIGAADAYGKTFASAGIRPFDSDARTVAERIASSPIKEQIVAALDHWASDRSRFQIRREPVARLLEVARLAAPDPAWADRLRQWATWTDREALAELARTAVLDDLSPHLLHHMALLLRDGKREQRIAWLRQAQARFPRDFWLNFEMANALAETYDLEATGFFWAAIAVRLDSHIAYNNLAFSLVNLKRYDEAIDACHKAIAIAPKASHAYNHLGLALHGQKRLDAAVTAFETAIALNPKNSRAYCNLGLALLDLKRFDRSIEALQKSTQIKPDPMTYINLGNAFVKQKHFPQAVAAYKNAIKLDEELAPAYFELGNVFAAQKQWDAAIAEYHKAIEMLRKDPADSLAKWRAWGVRADTLRIASVYVGLSFALDKKKRLKEAIDACLQAIEHDPKDAHARTTLGTLLHQLNRLDAALAAHNKAIELNPNHAPAYVHRGRVLQDQKRLDDAIAAYRKAITIEPKAIYYINLGTAHYDRKEFKEAISAYEQAIKLDESEPVTDYNVGDVQPAAHYNLGNAYLALKRLDEAITAYTAAIKLDPRHAKAFCNLGTALFWQKRYDEAANAYEKAIELDETFILAHTNLGEAFHYRKRLDDAIIHFRKAIALDPQYAPPRAGLAQVLRKKGLFDEAADQAQRALELLPPGDSLRQFLQHLRKQCQGFLALEKQLPLVLEGKADANAAELIALAQLYLDYLQRYPTAARLFHRAFQANPDGAKLARQYRLAAVRAAVLAGAGQGAEAAQLSDKHKGDMFALARAWLQADLDRLARQLEEGSPAGVVELCWELARWLDDSNLGRVRTTKDLAALPAEEQKTWLQFWTDARLLLKEARARFSEMSVRGALSAQQTSRLHEFKMTAGMTYVIDLESTAFDTYLILQDPKGVKLAENDDISPDNLNSRLVFTPQEDGVYRLVATSFHQQGSGIYTLTIRAFQRKKN